MHAGWGVPGKLKCAVWRHSAVEATLLLPQVWGIGHLGAALRANSNQCVDREGVTVAPLCAGVLVTESPFPVR